MCSDVAFLAWGPWKNSKHVKMIKEWTSAAPVVIQRHSAMYQSEQSLLSYMHCKIPWEIHGEKKKKKSEGKSVLSILILVRHSTPFLVVFWRNSLLIAGTDAQFSVQLDSPGLCIAATFA